LVLCASRPLIELVLRRRVQAMSNITLQPGCRATEIVPAAALSATRGVRFESGSGRPQTLEADLVVDASGRGAPTQQMLDALSWMRPAETEVGVDNSYATVVVPIPADAPDWKLLLTQPDPPTRSLNAVLAPSEGDRWMVLAASRGAAARLETRDAFRAALPHLIMPTLHDALRHVEPPKSIRRAATPIRWGTGAAGALISTRFNQRPDTLMQTAAAKSLNPLATHGRTIHMGQMRR
jgi:hypothetical protein